jgi:hypothetical protein
MFDSSSITSPGGILISSGVQQRHKGAGSYISWMMAVSIIVLRRKNVNWMNVYQSAYFISETTQSVWIKFGIAAISEKFSNKCTSNLIFSDP